MKDMGDIKVCEPGEYFANEQESVAAGHHPDCDGWITHVVRALRLPNGTFVPECSFCGPLPVVGSSSTPEGAKALAKDHERAEPCTGQC
jgi:hypothetical protein